MTSDYIPLTNLKGIVCVPEQAPHEVEVEGAGDRALGLGGDRGFLGRAEAGIVGDALELRREGVAELLLLA